MVALAMMMDAPEKFSEEDISNLLAECGIIDAHSVNSLVVQSESPFRAIGEAQRILIFWYWDTIT